jgi:hypothetical protein
MTGTLPKHTSPRYLSILIPPSTSGNQAVKPYTHSNKKTTDMKQEIVKILLQYFSHIGMDRPSNLDEIVDFIAEDIKETADVENWNSSDVSIGLRRWIESKI